MFDMAQNDVNVDKNVTSVVQGLDPDVLQSVIYETVNRVTQLHIEAARRMGDAARVHAEMLRKRQEGSDGQEAAELSPQATPH